MLNLAREMPPGSRCLTMILKAQVLVTTTSPESRFGVSAHGIADSVRMTWTCARLITTDRHDTNERRKFRAVFRSRTEALRRLSLVDFMIRPPARWKKKALGTSNPLEPYGADGCNPPASAVGLVNTASSIGKFCWIAVNCRVEIPAA